MKTKIHICIVVLLTSLLSSFTIDGSCPDTTPWSVPVNLSNSGNLTSNIFSAATSAGYMAVWVDSSNNAHYSFSSDAIQWSSGVISSSEGDVASNSDVFVAGNASGFIVTWIDSSNNAWSSFSADNGNSWSDALLINPNTLTLNASADVYVAGGSSGFVATMIGADNNAYVSFSTGTEAWSSSFQVTNDSSINSSNSNSVTGRGFVGAAINGNSCMLCWLAGPLQTASAYFDTINPFTSATTVYPITSATYPILAVGFCESAPVIAENNGYFMTAVRANINSGVTYFSVATIPSNWAGFSLFLSPNNTPYSGPWVAANSTGFMSTWVGYTTDSSDSSPLWTITTNNGFNWTPACSILQTLSTTIVGPVGLSANNAGFVATWLDNADSNAYASFYSTPLSIPSTSVFTQRLVSKYHNRVTGS